ncbi:MAG TPA: sugar transferase, partial [bacterium]
MKKWVDIFFSFLSDFLAFQVAFWLWWMVRLRLGFYAETDTVKCGLISFIISSFWLALFAFFGMYRNWKTASRIDELIDAVRTISIGILCLFITTFDYDHSLQQSISLSRFLIVVYWLLLVLCVGSMRMGLHTVQRKLVEKGFGRRRTLIVGWDRRARTLYDQIVGAPALGYDVSGFVSLQPSARKARYRGVPVVGSLRQLRRLLQNRRTEEIVIALPRRSEKQLEEVITKCNGLDIGIKMVPDLYDIMAGQVRTNQIYGFPLIEVFPQLITTWERVLKRMGDVFFSLIVLLFFFPVGLVIAAVIWLDSRGPVFYLQERVGKEGGTFNIIKFRSMVQNAEQRTGPVWARSGDPRVTRFGKWLRKLRLDEVPQFLNVLRGDMSLVGPRPERPFFVNKLKKIYPLYVRRLRVRPGITGWAQIKGEYDQTLED